MRRAAGQLRSASSPATRSFTSGAASPASAMRATAHASASERQRSSLRPAQLLDLDARARPRRGARGARGSRLASVARPSTPSRRPSRSIRERARGGQVRPQIDDRALDRGDRDALVLGDLAAQRERVADVKPAAVLASAVADPRHRDDWPDHRPQPKARGGARVAEHGARGWLSTAAHQSWRCVGGASPARNTPSRSGCMPRTQHSALRSLRPARIELPAGDDAVLQRRELSRRSNVGHTPCSREDRRSPPSGAAARLGRLARQRQHEARAAVLGRLDAHAAAVGLGDLAHDGQAEARARAPARGGAAVEAIEDRAARPRAGTPGPWSRTATTPSALTVTSTRSACWAALSSRLLTARPMRSGAALTTHGLGAQGEVDGRARGGARGRPPRPRARRGARPRSPAASRRRGPGR